MWEDKVVEKVNNLPVDNLDLHPVHEWSAKTREVPLPMTFVTPMTRSDRNEPQVQTLRIVSGNTSIDFAFGPKEVAMMAKAVARALGGTL